MFEYEGQQFTLEEVKAAADRRDLSVDDYVSQFNIKKVEEPKQEQEAGKTQPQVPGAPVEETAAPDTASKPEDTSLASQKIQTPTKRRKLKFSAPDMPGVYEDIEPVDLTYGEAAEKLKSTLATTEEEQAKYFADNYFKINEAPVKYFKEETTFTGAAGGMLKKSPDTQRNIEEYLDQNGKLKEYNEYLRDPIGFFKARPENIRNNSIRDQKSKIAVEFFRNLSDEERITFKEYLDSSFDVLNQHGKISNQLKKDEEDFNNKYNPKLERLKKSEETFLNWQKENEGKMERAEYMARSYAFMGDKEKTDSYVDILKNLKNEGSALHQEYVKAYKDLNNVTVDENGVESSFQKDGADLLKRSNAFQKQIEDAKIIYENYDDLDAAFDASKYEYDLFKKTMSQLKTSLYTLGGKAGAIGLNGLSYLASLRKDKGNAEMFNQLATASSDWANEQFQKHIDEFVPSPKAKDVTTWKGVGDMFLNMGADQASNIGTIWVGGIIGNILRAGGSVASAVNGVQKATAVMMGGYAGSAQHAQMDISQSQANLALFGTPTTQGLYDKLKQVKDPVERKMIQERINDLEYSFNVTELEKVATSLGYGATEMLAEYFGSIRVLSQWSNMGRSLAGTTQFKEQVGAVLKQAVKGVGIEEVEEVLTALGQNAISKYVAGDDRVNLHDGIDIDLVLSTGFTTLLLQGPSMSTTMLNVLNEQTLTASERKRNAKLSDEFLSLINEKNEAKANGQKFNKNSRLRALAHELGINSAINFTKLQNLSKEDFKRALDIESELKRLRAKYLEIGESGMLDESGKTDTEKAEDDALYAERSGKISKQINDLNVEKEAILEKVMLKKYLGKDFQERLEDIGIKEIDIAVQNQNLGQMNFQARIAKSILGKKRFFDLTTADEIQDIENISDAKRKALLDVFNEMQQVGAYAKYVPGIGAIYNKSNILQGVLANDPIAKNVYFHELGHWAMDTYSVDTNKLDAAVNELDYQLQTNSRIDKGSLQIYNDRIKQYKDNKTNAKDMREEIVMAYFDLNNAGVISDEVIEESRALKNMFKDMLNAISPSMYLYTNIESASDIKRFINALAKNIKEDRLRATSPEDYEKIKELKSKAFSLGQKELNDRVDNLVGKRDENGKYLWKSKEEFQNSMEFIDVYDKIINGNLIDPLIRRGIEGEVIYGKPVERFIEDVKDGLTGTIMRFDPTVNDSLIGWINLQLGRRKGDVSNQYKKEFGEFGTTSIDIEAGEVGSLREIEAEDQAFDEAIDIQEEVIDETKGLIIPGVEVLGEETNQELINEITDMYTDLVLDGKNYKTLPRLATKYVAEKAGVPEVKITDPKKNLSSGEYASAANFLSSIADTYIKILPEGAITQDAASEALKGTSTGVPKNVLNFAYNRNEERFKDPAGLFVFEKRKDLNKEQFFDAIGLNPDGSIKPGVTGRSKESQTVKGLLNLLDRIITNTAVRVVGSEMGMSMNTQLDIRSGTVDGVFSLGNVPAKQAAKDFARFTDAAVSKLNDYGLGDQAQRVKDLSNAMRTSDGPSGLQNFFLDVLKTHNEFVGLTMRLVPDNIFGFGRNVTVAKAAFQHTPRANAAGAAYQGVEGNRLVNPEWIERNTHKAFKYNSNSNETTDNLSDIAKSLISNSELNKLIGIDFAKSKIISSKTRELVKQFDADIKSVAPYNVTGINSKNWQAQMEKFDSAKWKKGITLANRILQSIIIDITNHFDPAINKNSTQEKFDQWLGYAINIYQGTTNDSNGFRKLSLVDVEKSYMYSYSEKNKRANALIGEHVPTNVDSMADMMIDNLFKRRISSVIPTVYIIPQIDSKAKDSKTAGLKNANDVSAVDDFLANRRALKRNEGRIIRYNKPGTLFAEKTKEENFADILNQVDQQAFDKQMTYSLNTAVKVNTEQIDDNTFIGEFKVSDINYQMNFIVNLGEDFWMGIEGKYAGLEEKLKVPKGTVNNLRIASLSFAKESELKDPDSDDIEYTYEITGDAAKGRVSQFTVLASVINAAKDLMKKTNVDAINFTAAEESRGQLYHKMARFFAKEMGWYTHSVYTDGSGTGSRSTSHTIYNPEVVLKDSKLTQEERQDWRINGIYSLGTLETKFAGMISMKDSRITPSQTLDLSTARNLAAKRKKRFDVINPAANDFEGLMYVLLGKGKLGEEQYEWMQKNLFEPYGQATYRLNNTRQRVARSLKKIEKENKELYKKLKKDSGFGGFTFEQALRVWMFSKINKTPSGVDEDTKKALIAIVKNNPDIEQLGYDLSAILPMQEFWVDPDPETWQLDSIRTDVINAIEKVARKQFLGEWKANVDEIFSKNNMNKLTAAFGEEYIDALKDMLYRMETGSSRPEGMNKQMNVFMNWVRGSVATTMFFNRRSFVLQQISNVNYLNWGDNNPIAAAKAFANQKQYWTDFVYILNSDYLKERRGGLKTDINAAELAEAAKKHGYKGVLSKILQAGFSLTQFGDSLAIATGGSTFYRNRVNTYLKQGLSTEEAERKAFVDFQEISEETQQSARPDRLSQQQTTIIGRTFLSFQNTPMQMTRLSVKAGKDLLAGRGDAKENVFKMLYYGAIQSIIFSMLQTALIGDMFSVFGDDEGDDEEKLRAKKTKRVINGVVDSFLKGTGMYGVAVSTAKNAIIKFIEQEQRKEEGKRPDYTYVLLEVLNISPPVGIKARNFYGALKNYEYNAKYVGAAGWSLNNPAIDIGSATVDALLNIPALSTVTTMRDISTAFDEDLEVMTRLALIAGWHTWDLNLQDKELNKIKAEVKEKNKQLRKSKKISRGRR